MLSQFEVNGIEKIVSRLMVKNLKHDILLSEMQLYREVYTAHAITHPSEAEAIARDIVMEFRIFFGT